MRIKELFHEALTVARRGLRRPTYERRRSSGHYRQGTGRTSPTVSEVEGMLNPG
jgi:hypothetical protein